MTDQEIMIAPETAFEPRSIDEAFKLAQRLVSSGFLPKAITKPESALAIIITGRELGLTVMQSLRSIHIIDGKPVLSADLMLALVKRSSRCQFLKLVESTGKIATYETQRMHETKTKMSFTIEQAQAAGVANKDNWKKYPDAMLRARCIAALARAVYPDLLMGIYETDEIPMRNESQTEQIIEPQANVDMSEQDIISAYRADIRIANSIKELNEIAKKIGNEEGIIRQELRKPYADKMASFSKKPKTADDLLEMNQETNHKDEELPQ